MAFTQEQIDNMVRGIKIGDKVTLSAVLADCAAMDDIRKQTAAGVVFIPMKREQARALANFLDQLSPEAMVRVSGVPMEEALAVTQFEKELWSLHHQSNGFTIPIGHA